MLQIAFWFAFLLIAHVYVGYPVGMYLRSKVQGDADRLDRDSDPDWPAITVLIPAYNEERSIARKIENTLALQYSRERLQVVIASDGSTDNTVVIAKQYAHRGIEVDHNPQRSGKMETENRVVPKARGEIVLVTDASALLTPDVLHLIARHFADPKVGCVTGSRVCLSTESAASEGEGLYWRYESWIKQSESRLGTCLGANGQLMAVRKSLFPRIPDCNDDLYVPMNILITRGAAVRYEPRAKAWIPAAANLPLEWQRKIRTHVSLLRNLRYLKAGLNPFTSSIWWRFLSHHVLRMFVPFAMVASFVLSLLLWHFGTFYRVMVVAQCLFYVAAFTGFIAAQRGIRFRVLYIPFYFVFANSAVLLAWMHWGQRRHYHAWSSTERVLPRLSVDEPDLINQPDPT